VTLGDGTDKGRVTLRCKTQSHEDEELGEEIILASLSAGAHESQTLDLIFDSYTEFTVVGKREVHVAGYYVPEEEVPESDDEDDEDDEAAQMMRMYGMEAMDDGDSDDSDDSDEEGMEDDSDDDGRPRIPASKVTIEELPEEEEEEESEEEEEESEEEEEEEEPVVEKKGAGKKAAQAKEEPAAKGRKRAAEEAARKEAEAAQGKKAKSEAAASPAAGASGSGEGDLAKAGMVKEYENGFKIEQTAVGKTVGAVAKAGKRITMKYVGKLASNGRVFDQNKAFKFRLGVGEVIKGWDRGVVGMRVGDKRRLTIPPQMAYGASGVPGAIPRNATLVFDVELVRVD